MDDVENGARWQDSPQGGRRFSFSNQNKKSLLGAPMRNLDVAAVTVGDCDRAADLNPAKLSALYPPKGHPTVSPRDKVADSSGDRRLLCLRSCHSAALVAALVPLGLRHAVAGAIARVAVADPALYAEQAYLLQQDRQSVVVVASIPTTATAAIVVDATAVISTFNERLAARVPELRPAGIV
jgi:hypothetical protein